MSEQNSVRSSTGYWVTRLARAMERDFEQRLEPLGITRGAFAVLSAIHHDKKTRPAELAAFLGVHGAAITRHLDRVEKQGLIERAASATDRRAIDISLTTDGREAVRKGRGWSRATNKKFTAGLADTEMENLHALIQKMLSHFDDAVADL